MTDQNRSAFGLSPSFFHPGRSLILALLPLGGLGWAVEDAQHRSHQLSAGSEHVLIVRDNGSLWTAGGNAFGQLGSGTLESQRQLQQPAFRSRGTGHTWRKVSAGADYSLAIREDGTLWSFGKNNSAQLGRDMRKPVLRPWQTGKNRWIDVAAGVTVTLAIRADSSLRVWGGWSDEHQAGEILKGLEGQSRLLAPGNWSKVAMGANHALALRGDGSLWAMGDTQAGQLGCKDASRPQALCRVDEGKWSALAAGSHFSLAIREDGSLWSWGANSQGELGRGSLSESEVVGQIGAEKWLAVSAGHHHVLALRADSTLWAWGAGADGALGSGSTENSHTPTQIDPAKWLAIAAGPRTSLAQRIDGGYLIWGRLEGLRGPGAKALRPVDLMNLEGQESSPITTEPPAQAPVVAEAPLAPMPVATSTELVPTVTEKPILSASIPQAPAPVTVTPEFVSAVTTKPRYPDPPAAVSPAPTWVAANKTLLMAGGGALAVGGLLWAVLGVHDVGSLPIREPDLGLPPNDPITGGAR